MPVPVLERLTRRRRYLPPRSTTARSHEGSKYQRTRKRNFLNCCNHYFSRSHHSDTEDTRRKGSRRRNVSFLRLLLVAAILRFSVEYKIFLLPFEWVQHLSSRRYEFGNVALVYTSLRETPRFQRTIRLNDMHLYNQEREAFLETIDHSRLGKENSPQWQDLNFGKKARTCLPPRWITVQHPNCQLFHELSLDRSEDLQQQAEFPKIRYLAHGYFRNTFMLSRIHTNISHYFPRDPTIVEHHHHPNATQLAIQAIVLKQLRYSKQLDFLSPVYDMTRSEAVLLDEFAASERFGNIYGFCGTSTLVEAGAELTYKVIPQQDERYQPAERGSMTSQALEQWQHDMGQEGPPRLNKLSPDEKLVIAIAMMESMAEMHGFARGVIVHNDVQPEQWMVSPRGRLFLNDVNNAHPLAYSIRKQQYCPFKIQYGGTLRAPEEYKYGPVDETADVWVVGHLLYSLLTGLWPYYEMFDSDDVRTQTLQGRIPHIDPQWENSNTTSFIEWRIVQIMKQCYKREPKDRIDIFSILRHLRETKTLHHSQGRR